MTGQSLSPSLSRGYTRLKVTPCLIDGEAVTCSGTGLADFDRLWYGRGESLRSQDGVPRATAVLLFGYLARITRVKQAWA